MTRLRRPSLRFLSLNVNGLRSAILRQQLFSQLLEGSWDIVLLQETHHAGPEEGGRWAREGAGPSSPWTGTAYWNSYTTTSRGVAVLLKPGVAISDIDYQAADGTGRLQRLDFSFEGANCTLINAYAPCEPDQRPAFFSSELLSALPTDRRLILGGDWNCIPSLQDQVGSDGFAHAPSGGAVRLV
jgi:exonuclease III